MGSGIYETGSYLGVLIFGAVLHAAATVLFVLLWYAFNIQLAPDASPTPVRRKTIEYRQYITAASSAANFVMAVTCIIMIAGIGKVDRASDGSVRRVDIAYFGGSAIAAVFCAIAATTFYRTRTLFVIICVALVWLFGFLGLSVASLSVQLDRRNWCIAVAAGLLLCGDVLMVVFGWAWRKRFVKRVILWVSLLLLVAVQTLFCVVFSVSRDNEPRRGVSLEFRWQSQLIYTFFSALLLGAMPLYWLYDVIVKKVDIAPIPTTTHSLIQENDAAPSLPTPKEIVSEVDASEI